MLRSLSQTPTVAFPSPCPCAGTNAHVILQPCHEAVSVVPSTPVHTQDMRLPCAWVKQYTSILPPAHSLLRAVQASAAGPSWVRFQADVGHISATWLRDHVVGGRPVVPGAAYLDMALSAARLAMLPGAGASVALCGVFILAPLVLPPVHEPQPVVEVVLDAEEGLFEVVSRAAGGSVGAAGPDGAEDRTGSSVTHVQGSLCRLSSQGQAAPVPGQGRGKGALSADACRARTPEPQGVAALYCDLAAAGLQYGPRFRGHRCVHRVSEGSGAQGVGASSHISVPEIGPSSSFVVHPAALDCAFQLGAVVPDAAQEAGVTYVPTSVALFYAAPQPRMGGSGSQLGTAATGGDEGEASVLYATAGIGAGDAAGAAGDGRAVPGALYRDVSLCLPCGTVLAQVLRVESRPVGKQAMARGGAATAAAPALRPEEAAQLDMLYEVSWQVEEPDDVAAGPEGDIESGPDSAAGAAMLQLESPSAGGLEAPVAQTLQAMQGLLQGAQHAASPGMHLRRPTSAYGAPNVAAAAVPGAAASALVAALPQMLASALQGMVRSAAREAPNLSLGCSQHSAADPRAGGARTALVLAPPGAAPAPFDGYGAMAVAAARLTPRVLPAAAALPTPGRFQLVPSPRGALSNLVPQPMEVPGGGSSGQGAVALAPGTVLLAVKAVGINFRDVLNVSTKGVGWLAVCQVFMVHCDEWKSITNALAVSISISASLTATLAGCWV